MHKIPRQQNKRRAKPIQEINSSYKSFFDSKLSVEALTFALIAVYKREHASGLSVIAINIKRN